MKRVIKINRNNRLISLASALLLTLALFGNLSSTFAQQATFTTGTVYSSTQNLLSGAASIDVVPPAGGAISSTFPVPFATPQMAWSPDLTTAYATTNGGGAAAPVLKLTPTGIVTTFATPGRSASAFAIGVHPDGRVLLAPLDADTVLDISAGGAGPFPVYATVPGFGFFDQNYAMLRTSAGRLLISGSQQKIYDITDPANITVFADASGLPGPLDHFYDMAEGPSGEIYAIALGGQAVIKVTGGVASIFATIPFLDGDSVTFGYGKVLVSGLFISPSLPRLIFDISAGGNFPTAPAPFATQGSLSIGKFILKTVPAPPSPQAQAAALIAQVQALATAGVLTQNQSNALINKLNQAITTLTNGQVNASCGLLGAFINQVNAFINNGSLTAAQGQTLIDAANAIKTASGC